MESETEPTVKPVYLVPGRMGTWRRGIVWGQLREGGGGGVEGGWEGKAPSSPHTFPEPIPWAKPGAGPPRWGHTVPDLEA